ncbi:ferric reductase NAD binding domain-containing protein [Lipomyces tetrasporus]|uniref:ferric-chelate reductase (NADPH) n=1 Tax=Lipomyces tetrasporus TaxID=54092 RepID=A0AAD7VQK7_9ASCO|nr:ferric reductase NAD binding domain-containing protein [Lipomyces tetrasporus]KAJ8098228.1 ferric reductase NAD binding domain-containing protein [Lipomyces tetrasporus]
MCLLSLILACLVYIARVLAETRNFPYCAYTCITVVYGGNWGCNEFTGDEYVSCVCNNNASVETFALCSNEYCGLHKDGSYGIVENYCGGYAAILSYDDALAGGLERGIPYSDVDPALPLSAPFYTPLEVYQSLYPTMKAFYGNMRFGEIYGGATMIFWFGVFFIAFLQRMAMRVFPSLTTKSFSTVNGIRRRILLPAVFNGVHTAPLRFLNFDWALLPTRGESLAITVYMLMNFIFLFVNYDLFLGNYYWPTSTNIQLIRYFSDRTGIMAFVQTPALILFASRNNFLSWLTGWGFQRAMVYHRWVARVMYFNAVIHSIGYTAYGLYYGKGTLASYYEDTYWKWGVVCMSFGTNGTKYSSQFISSSSRFSSLDYGTNCEDLGYMEYVYASIAIWAFDRVIRIVRLTAFGLTANAEAKIIGDVIELQVTASCHGWIPRAGQYAYIYFRYFNFWENHPFSLVEKRGDKYIFVAKAKGGVTKKLWNYLSKKPDSSAQLGVWIEGPYGEKFNTMPFGTVLLIAGGIGISALYGYATELKQQAKAGQQHVILVWVCRREDTVYPLATQIFEMFKGNGVEVHLYFTDDSKRGSTVKEEVRSNDEKSTDMSNASSDDAIEFVLSSAKYTRPDLTRTVTDVVRSATTSVAVVVCGPAEMNDECRRATVANVDCGTARVEYFEESFAWA